jgi:hypothetical protein
MKFTKKRADEILNNKIDSSELAQEYPEFVEAVTKEFSAITENSSAEDIMTIINVHKAKAKFAIDKIRKSNESPNIVNTFLPDVVKARIAIYMLEQFYHAAKMKSEPKINSNKLGMVNEKKQKTRLGYWDGILLQKVLFENDLVRKQVSLFWFRIIWKLVKDKSLLMPLVNERGIYCFYSKELIQSLSSIIGGASCLEIAAGDGTLTKFLKQNGTECVATDDYSWEHYIKYPEFVERLEAKEALKKYQPEVVICSWTPPDNTFEKQIFQTDSVQTYIVIGTSNPLVTGNHTVYQSQEHFQMETSETMSAQILPPATTHAVYIFRRESNEYGKIRKYN